MFLLNNNLFLFNLFIETNETFFFIFQAFDQRTIGRTTTGTNISNKNTNVGDVSRSQDETNVININGTNPKSTSILLPLPIFENSKFPVEKRANRIPKISKRINN